MEMEGVTAGRADLFFPATAGGVLRASMTWRRRWILLSSGEGRCSVHEGCLAVEGVAVAAVSVVTVETVETVVMVVTEEVGLSRGVGGLGASVVATGETCARNSRYSGVLRRRGSV